MTFSALERRFGEQALVFADRVRSSWLELRGASLGEKTRVGAGCVIRRPWCFSAGERLQLEHHVHIKATCDGAKIRMGSEVFVGFGCEFDISDSLSIGSHVLIAPGCFITDHGHLHESGRLIASQGCESKPILIEDDVWLGAKAVVMPGVRLGRGAIVGAGAVVTRDVAPNAIVAGVPARQIGMRS